MIKKCQTITKNYPKNTKNIQCANKNAKKNRHLMRLMTAFPNKIQRKEPFFPLQKPRYEKLGIKSQVRGRPNLTAAEIKAQPEREGSRRGGGVFFFFF